MKPATHHIILAALGLSLGLGLWSHTAQGEGAAPALPKVKQAEEKPAEPELDMPRQVQFDPIKMGIHVKTQIPGTNKGGEPVVISKVRPSCGCTLVDFPKDAIKPGDTINIEASIDTNQKLGKVTKSVSVYLKGRARPQRVMLTGNVEPNLKSKDHGKMHDHNIFKKDCASCHSTPGKNKYGYDLYLADCATCHGVFMEGASAPGFPDARVKQITADDLYNKIDRGSGVASGMPGFGEAHGGPLNKNQIDSLVSFLKQGIVYNKPAASKKGRFRGRSVYFQLCASCHGSSRKGPIGPPITADDLAGLSSEELTKLLADGNPDSKMMPPYHVDKGGLLDDEDLEALVTYLKGGR